MRDITRAAMRGTSTLSLSLAIQFGLPTSAMAVLTPYAQEPAALCTNLYNSGLLWDQQFASKLGSFGQQYYIFDFCHSGGFIGDVAGGGRYVAAACEWDEYGFGTAFNNPFWTQIGNGSSVSGAFLAGFSASNLLQTPSYSDPGGLANQALQYRAGDLAFIYSSNASPDLGTGELDNVSNALKKIGWNNAPSSAIQQFHGVLSPDKFDAIYAATKDPANADRRIIVYLGDHGASTDVIKSRANAGRYEYEYIGSIGRVDTDPGGLDYGIAKLVTEVDLLPFPEWPLTYNQYYSGVTPPKQTWRWTVSGNEVTWYSAYPEVTDTWLEPGVAYDFGFSSPYPPTEVGWESWVFDPSALPVDQWDMNDWGVPRADHAKFGDGDYVWTMNLSPHLDPYQWPLWHNGGDGWIQAPMIPEPTVVACVALFAFTIRTRR